MKPIACLTLILVIPLMAAAANRDGLDSIADKVTAGAPHWSEGCGCVLPPFAIELLMEKDLSYACREGDVDEDGLPDIVITVKNVGIWVYRTNNRQRYAVRLI